MGKKGKLGLVQRPEKEKGVNWKKGGEEGEREGEGWRRRVAVRLEGAEQWHWVLVKQEWYGRKDYLPTLFTRCSLALSLYIYMCVRIIFLLFPSAALLDSLCLCIYIYIYIYISSSSSSSLLALLRLSSGVCGGARST